MKIIKATAAFLIAAIAACSFCGCDRIRNLLPKEDPDRIVSYTNDDYHFTLTHPAYFKKTEVKESEENGDEINIKLIADDDDLIDIDIRYKNEGGVSSSDLYGYITRNGLDKNRLVPLTTNSFAYDDREGETSSYFIYAATKRMVYVISYAHNADNEKEQFVIDSLRFSFDAYANVPKENAFLSDPVTFAAGFCKLHFLADAEISSDIEPAYDENGAPDYMFCRKITESSQFYTAAFSAPLIGRYNYLQFDDTDIEADAQTVTEEILPGLQDLRFKEAYARTNGAIRYKIIYFDCSYGGRPATGSLTAGFKNMNYFEYVCVICEDADDPEIRNYTDMIGSFTP